MCKEFDDCFSCTHDDCIREAATKEKRAEYFARAKERDLEGMRKRDNERKRAKYQRDKELREAIGRT